MAQRSNTPQKTDPHRDKDGIPTAWVVWIDDNMGYQAPNWEINNPGPNPEEPLQKALEHAADTLRGGFPTAIMPVGVRPSTLLATDGQTSLAALKSVQHHLAMKLQGGNPCPGPHSRGECAALDYIGMENGKPTWAAYLYIYLQPLCRDLMASTLVDWFTECGCQVVSITADLFDPDNEVVDGKTEDGTRPLTVTFIPPAGDAQ